MSDSSSASSSKCCSCSEIKVCLMNELTASLSGLNVASTEPSDSTASKRTSRYRTKKSERYEVTCGLPRSMQSPDEYQFNSVPKRLMSPQLTWIASSSTLTSDAMRSVCNSSEISLVVVAPSGTSGWPSASSSSIGRSNRYPPPQLELPRDGSSGRSAKITDRPGGNIVDSLPNAASHSPTSMIAAERLAPWSSLSRSVAPLKSAPTAETPNNTARKRIASQRIARSRLAPARFASLKIALVRSAPLMSTPRRSTLLKLAPRKSAPGPTCHSLFAPKRS